MPYEKLLEIFQIYSPNLISIALNCSCNYYCFQEYVRSLRNPIKELLKFKKYNDLLEIKTIVNRFLEELYVQKKAKKIRSKDFFIISGLFQDLSKSILFKSS